jgi:hypothetical protein
MQNDQQIIKAISEGGPFDPVEAIRAMSRVLASAPAKEAPPAVMVEPDAAPAKKRTPKDNTATE